VQVVVFLRLQGVVRQVQAAGGGGERQVAGSACRCFAGGVRRAGVVAGRCIKE